MNILRRLSVLLLLALAACVPAQVPDQLFATAGPPIVMDGDWVRGEIFSVRVPQGWRVITGEASQPQRLILSAPDNLTTIELQVGEALLSTDEPIPDIRQVIRLSTGVVTITLRTVPEQHESMQLVLAQVVASLTADA